MSPPSFTCPRCQAVSYNPHDIAAGYCGRCHEWTGSGHAAPVNVLQELLEFARFTDERVARLGHADACGECLADATLASEARRVVGTIERFLAMARERRNAPKHE